MPRLDTERRWRNTLKLKKKWNVKDMSQRLKRRVWLIMTGKSMPHATHGHRGHVPTSAAKITKESAVNHKEIDTNGVNRMLLRRPWRTDQKNRFLYKVWTPQFSTTPPKPFLLSFSTHLGDQTLARSIWKRKSQFSNWPKDYWCLRRGDIRQSPA